MASSMTPPPDAKRFLASAGWDGAEICALAGDASFRRYFRVSRGNERAVLMDAPPPHEDPRPFVNVATWLSALGFLAPRIIAQDLDVGLLLLEDFGDRRMRETLDDHPELEKDLYRDVVALLADLHRVAAPSVAAYDNETYQREIRLFTEWYCPALGLEVDQSGFVSAWDGVLQQVVADQPRVLVLRDYHAENIMLVAEDDGQTRLGLLDFQDALAGHPAYDLVSMLQDARRDVSVALEAEMRSYYTALAAPPASFDAAYAILGAQRNTKILGIFTRLWKRDNKPHYRKFQARVWNYLERDLRHPSLAPVRAWFDANIPTNARGAAWSAYVD